MHETMYAHTDKATYVAGEIIWFKLYNLDAGSLKKSGLSKVAYVDVLDAQNNIIIQAKIAMKEGSGSGSAQIPLRATTGNYNLRVYTAWMKNFGTSQLFEKPITIINTIKNLEPAALDSGHITVQLFPEGGNLVVGLESKVAVKVTERNGKGVQFTGAVISEKGDTLTTVNALKFGTGQFTITPTSNQNWYVAVNTPLGLKAKKELPKAYEQGYVMHVSQPEKNQLTVTVAASGSLLQNSSVYLFAINHQALIQAQQKGLNNGQAQFSFEVAKLPEGITQFTLFNEDQKPVCERLFFKKPQYTSNITIVADAIEYSTRTKTALTIAALDTARGFMPADLSLSVYKSEDAGTEEATLLHQLYLSADVTGTIESPNYYFSDTARTDVTDNLMLTHGWRRFRWDTMLHVTKTAFTYPLEFQGPLIRAAVTDLRTRQRAANIPAFLSIPGAPFQFFAAQTDSAGIAQFNIPNYYGPGEVIFQTNTQNDSVYRIEPLSPFAATDSGQSVPRYTFSKAHADAILQQSISMQVQQLYSRDSITRFAVPAILDTIPFFGRPDYSYPLDVYTRFQTMEEVLREFVLPINVVQRRGNLQLLLLDAPRRQFFDGGELVLLDGIPLFDKNKIFSYDPLKVKKLDVVTRKYFIGPTMFNGIASFTTYNGTFDGFQLDPRAIVVDYEGLQLEREFYAPVYETETQRKSRIPDFRNTLLWKPQVTLDKNGRAIISFYTSDQKGTYRVMIEGIDENGKVAVATTSILVK
ncbi:MAG TPA: hypothetical protein VM010_08585 [Chitinophagaceae bacterium]|nr:hypothetical protein [Chitinophagaceae bacterium]